MKYRKENAAVFNYEFSGGSKIGAKLTPCKPSVSLEDYIERELKLKAQDFLHQPTDKIKCGVLKAFSLN